MNNNFRQNYKVNQNSIEKSFDKQMGLKMNEQYENWADDTGVEILEYFFNKYNGITVEIPKMREKSPKSLLGKIKNLQIERLSKLYNLEGISEKDKNELYKLLEERIYESKKLDSEKSLNSIKEILYKNIEDVNVDDIEKNIMIEGISKSTKTALLRILVGKLEKSNLEDKNEKIEKLDEKYGKKAFEKTGLVEDDIIGYKSIINLRTDERTKERLRDEEKFLKANDLRGMKIVVVDVPDDLETNNEKIKEILAKRKQAKTNDEKIMYTHECIVEIGKEFYEDLANNEEFLKKTSMQVIPNSSKHKKKSNGYEAQHIKFYNEKEPEYTLELQFKSEYVENISRGEGAASHENRPGKSRILPTFTNNQELVTKLNYLVPKYKIFRRNGDKVVVEKLSMAKNVIGYFQGKLEPESEEYNKIIELLEKKDSNEIAM